MDPVFHRDPGLGGVSGFTEVREEKVAGVKISHAVFSRIFSKVVE